MPTPRRNRLAAIVDAPWFTSTILAVIVVNAIALGLETYPGIDDRWGDAALPAERASASRSSWSSSGSASPRTCRARSDFFRDGWNVFDFVVIGAAFVPGVRESATLLRLVRLARVIRVVRLLPDVRVLLAGV